MTKKQLSMVAAAGPVSNLLLAILFAIAYAFTSFSMFSVGCVVNCMLFLFNILPMPNLDGWGILEPHFPAMERISPKTKRTIFIICFILIWVVPFSSLALAMAGMML